jgi:hypothetical protein
MNQKLHCNTAQIDDRRRIWRLPREREIESDRARERKRKGNLREKTERKETRSESARPFRTVRAAGRWDFNWYLPLYETKGVSHCGLAI